MVLLVRIELTTPSLRVTCSTIEPQQPTVVQRIYHNSHRLSTAWLHYILYSPLLPAPLFSLSFFSLKVNCDFIQKWHPFFALLFNKSRFFSCDGACFNLHNSTCDRTLQIVIHIFHIVFHRSFPLISSSFPRFFPKFDETANGFFYFFP